MIIIILAKSERKGEKIVSHGIDSETMAVIPFPQENADVFLRNNKARFDAGLGEYVLEGAP